MSLKHYSLLAFLAMGSLAASGQTIKAGYVEEGDGNIQFLNTVQTWNSTYKVTDDDNFFVSRIKSKPRFRNTATQVMTTLTEANDKRLCAWFPWEDQEKGVGQNALPHGNFDTEVFSMWSYVSHWGNYSAPLGRVPAALLDVAHKNGVSVSGTAFVANGPLSSSPYDTYMASLTEDLGRQTANLLYYFGDDGVGYNSEFSTTTSTMDKIISYHKALMKQLLTLGNDLAECIWYEGTTDGGQISFNSGLASSKNLWGTAENPGFNLISDYQTMNTSTLSKIVTNANSTGRSSLNFYASCNLQTGISGGWQTLKDYPVSIGLWGAHKNNMFFQQRYRGGSAPATQQRTYLLSTERWFGGGYRNPVKAQTPFQNLNYAHTNITKNPGMCSMMSARSTLCWDLSSEPFVTFFNIGNGTFLNYKGERANNNEWGNVGVQDYLPTWRFWFHNNWLGRDAANVPDGIDAQFVWDDAYVGGSCLEISGTNSGSYLHLFKTQFALQAGDVITVRYKLAGGSGDVDLAFSTVGAEDTPITGNEFNLIASSQHHDGDVWEERTFTVGDGNTLAGKTLAVVALHFNNLSDAKIYLGEFSIVRGTSATPAAPTDLRTSVVYKGVSGIDAKLLWEMPGKKAMPEPTYNLDVNTSLFKVYSQIDSNEPVLMALTTSWAGFSFQTPTNGTKVRFGVSAVSTDFASESAITWGEWYTIGDLTYDYNDNIQIDNPVVHPGEEFTISYVDPAHEDATWTILDKDGVEKATGTGKSITATLDEAGLYDLVVNGYVHEDGVTATPNTTTYGEYISISPASTGSKPEIYTFTLDGQTEGIKINKNEDHLLEFTARQTDGKVSTGINTMSRFFGPKMADIGLPAACTVWSTTKAAQKATASNTKSWTISFWMKPHILSGSWINIVNPAGDWPRNNWGRSYGTIHEDGKMDLYVSGSGSHSIYGTSIFTYDAQLAAEKWTHVCLVNEFKTDYYLKQASNQDSLQDVLSAKTVYVYTPHIYINGKKLEPIDYAWASYQTSIYGEYRHHTYLDGYTNREKAYNLQSRMPYMINSYIMLSGPTRLGGLEATIDHIMVFDKALNDAEVLTTMNDITSAPSNIKGYWDFDNTEIDTDFGAKSLYGDSNHKIYLYDSEAGSGEGVAIVTPTELDEVAGYPFLDANHEVKTIPTWDVPGADIKSSSLTTSSKKIKAAGDLTGSATVSWPTDAYRDITLTLTNDYGSDSKTITAVRVGDPVSGIDDIWADQDKLQIIQSQDVVIVRVEEAGQYEFRLFAADGRIIDQKADHMTAGNSVTLNLPNQGVYILSIVKDGKLYNGYKFIRQ